MTRRTARWPAALCATSATLCLVLWGAQGRSAAGQAAEGQSVRLVIAGYPDATEWLAADLLRRLAAEYEKTRPGVDVEIRPGPSYRRARELALSDSVAGIMISEPTNNLRAYKAQTGPKRGHTTLELDKFIPIAKRVIRSEKEVLGEVRLGIATAHISSELKAFLDFLSTDAARRALRSVPHIEPVERLPEPRPVREIQYHDEKVTLSQPIWVYGPAPRPKEGEARP